MQTFPPINRAIVCKNYQDCKKFSTEFFMDFSPMFYIWQLRRYFFGYSINEIWNVFFTFFIDVQSQERRHEIAQAIDVSDEGDTI